MDGEREGEGEREGKGGRGRERERVKCSTYSVAFSHSHYFYVLSSLYMIIPARSVTLVYWEVATTLRSVGIPTALGTTSTTAHARSLILYSEWSPPL